MRPEEASDRIRSAILARPELRWKSEDVTRDLADKWNVEDRVSPYVGFCYIATQVFCNLVPDAVPMTDGARKHFWAELDGKVWDLTIDQFGSEGYDHSIGRTTRFKGMCRRARELRSTALGVLC